MKQLTCSILSLVVSYFGTFIFLKILTVLSAPPETIKSGLDQSQHSTLSSWPVKS